MSENPTRKEKVVTSLFWKFSEKMGARIVGFLISIVLARILSPDDYGTLAILLILMTLTDALVVSGLGNSLIQKKNADALDFSSVFYFSMVMVVLFYLILFFVAPVIARYYSNGLLIPMLRVLGIRLIFSGIGTVQNAYVDRNMLYRRYFFSTLSGTILSGLAALWMALHGFGVWALVAQYLSQAFISTAVLWFTVKWRPARAFSLARLKSLYSFGWKLLLSKLIYTGCSELRGLIIGRLYSPSDLGYYTRGSTFPKMLDDGLTTAINSVLFPVVSQEQFSPNMVKAMIRRSIRTTAYVIVPIMTGLAVVADPLVCFLLTEKWRPCVPYLQIFCYCMALNPIQQANVQAIKAIGRSDITLKVDIVKESIGVAVLLFVMNRGMLLVAISAMINATIFMIAYISPNKKLINYRLSEQMIDILPYIGLSVIMAAAIYPIHWLRLPALPTLIFQMIAGGTVYLLCSVLFKVESFRYILDILMRLIKRRRAGH
jgi:O-antigen/teichoic acid export membrane protein